jgi:putative membrane protein
MPSEPLPAGPPPRDAAAPGPLGPPTTPAAGRFTGSQRLHPASVVLGVNLRQLIQALLFPVVAGLASGRTLTFGLLAVFGLATLGYRVLAWQRFTFSFDGEVVRVDEGVLSRNHRALDVARIQQVELDRGAVQRLFGLASLRIETAGSSSEVEVELRVLPEPDAQALREAVRAGRARALAATRHQRGARHGPSGSAAATTNAAVTAVGDGSGLASPADRDAGDAGDEEEVFAPDDPVRREVGRIPLRHVALGAVTGAQLLVFPAVLAAAFQFVGELATNAMDQAIERLVDVGLMAPQELLSGPRLSTVVLVLVATIVLSLATALAAGVLREANFVVTRVGEDLHFSRGLLSTRDSVVPLRRVQLVEIQRNWARRLLGAASIRIHSAGGSADAARRVALPLVPDGEVDRWLRELLPGVTATPTLRPHPPTALRRAVLRWVRPSLVVTGLVWLLWLTLPDVVLDALPTVLEDARWWVLALPVVAGALGVVEYRQLAHGVTELVVASRQGALSVTTTLAPLVKVQAVGTRRSFFQRRLGLATVTARVAGPGGDVEVLDVGAVAGADLHAELTRHAASPAVLELTTAPDPGDEPVRSPAAGSPARR